MFNSASGFNSGSYVELRQRILKDLRSAKIDDRVLEVLRSAAEESLATQNLVLSRVERRRLVTDVLKSELAELARQLDEGQIAY